VGNGLVTALTNGNYVVASSDWDNGTVTDAGNNICADGSLALGGSSFINTDPKLGTFGDNGGATKTLRPLTGSPAINAGNDTAILNLDQRGFTRPVGTHADIGSVETTPPTITTSPSSQTNIVGNNVTFSVTASGDVVFAYQWRFNGANISGATSSSYTLTSVTTNSAGNYQVVVTNDFGAVTSVVAALTVLVPPTITAQPVDLTLLAGGSGSFVVAAFGESPLSYPVINGSSTARISPGRQRRATRSPTRKRSTPEVMPWSSPMSPEASPAPRKL
jgi:hypothetical protein